MNLPAASGRTLVACGLTSLSAVCGSLDALGPAARAERLRRPDAPDLERARHDEVCHRASSGNYGAWSKNGTQAGGRRAPGDTSGGDRAVALPDGRGIGPCGRRRAAGQNGGSAESRAASGRYDAAAPSHVSSVTATTRAVLAAVCPSRLQSASILRGPWGSGELLIDLEEDKAARAVIFGLLAEMERKS
jgi:hypothetical protein